MQHVLDRPIWSALATRHAGLAEGGRLARRYPASIAPFAATGEDGAGSLAALTGLAAPGERMLIVMADRITVPEGLVTLSEAPVVQMIADEPPQRVADERIEPLTEADAAEMLALAELTKPGPFSLRAQSLGKFWGIKLGERLVAMAGERMKQPGLTELSGVCTHPDVRGEGLGRLMSLYVAGQIFGRGEQAYLHAYAGNTAAIALYRSIGFRLRSDMNLALVARPD